MVESLIEEPEIVAMCNEAARRVNTIARVIELKIAEWEPAEVPPRKEFP